MNQKIAAWHACITVAVTACITACSMALLRAAKVMSTWQHASLLRLQPRYVYILGNSKGAVTTALQAHSPRRRLIGVKKDRSAPSPLPPSLPRCHSPSVMPLLKQRKCLFCSFIVFGLTSPKARLQPRPQLSKSVVTTARPTLSVCALRKLRALALCRS